jgi:hypothetical protein
MRLLMTFAVLCAVGLAAFFLALSGLGAVGNFVVFAAASFGLLLVTVNLTSARNPARVSAPEEAQEPPGRV